MQLSRPMRHWRTLSDPRGICVPPLACTEAVPERSFDAIGDLDGKQCSIDGKPQRTVTTEYTGRLESGRFDRHSGIRFPHLYARSPQCDLEENRRIPWASIGRSSRLRVDPTTYGVV